MSDSRNCRITHRKFFDNNLQGLEQLIFWVGQYAAQNGFRKKQITALEIAVEEAAVNIIHHAKTEKKIEIILQITKEKIEVTFIDQGEPFNPLEQGVAPKNLPLEKMPIGGLGIFLIKNLVEEVEYQRKDNKNILRFSKRKPSYS